MARAPWRQSGRIPGAAPRPILPQGNARSRLFRREGRERLGGYIRLSIEERREGAHELSSSGHGVREVGEILGISKSQAAEDVQSWTPLDAVATLAADAKGERAIR
jgi:hypothetical protein